MNECLACGELIVSQFAASGTIEQDVCDYGSGYGSSSGDGDDR